MSKRVLGLDFGLARIGVALSDPLGVIASPLETIEAKRKMEFTVKTVIERVAEIEKEKGCTIETLVVGMPLMMNGSVGIQGDEVRAFAQGLEESFSGKVVLWDERLTTVQAERSMRESGMSRKKRSKVVDKTAAALILQSYLDQFSGEF